MCLGLHDQKQGEAAGRHSDWEAVQGHDEQVGGEPGRGRAGSG
jgi:hypothetical protein